MVTSCSVNLRIACSLYFFQLYGYVPYVLIVFMKYYWPCCKYYWPCCFDLVFINFGPKKMSLIFPRKGGRGCPMSPPSLESQGCHSIPPYYLLSCSSAYSQYSFCLVFICLLAHFLDFFSGKFFNIFREEKGFSE